MMTPARTGRGKGNFEFDRLFAGVGRIRCSSGTSVLREFHRRDAILTKLFETSQLELLRAFQSGTVTMAQLVEADRHGRGGETLALVKTRAPLWSTIDATLPLMGRTKGTRDRYALSFRQVRKRAAVLGEHATIADLQRVNWRELRTEWPGSPADWNRMRTAVSRLLSIVTGDKFSPFRRAVVAMIPLADEPPGRTPDLTPAQFIAVLDRIVDDDVRAALMVLVLTGMRVGEYLSLDRSHLQPGNNRLRIPQREGNKTGSRVVALDPDVWGWIVAGIPFAGAPVPAVRKDVESDPRYRRIWKHWAEGLAAEGITDVRVHDLRHCAGQWASDAGESDGAVQQLLGQKDPRMAARYTKQKAARAASAAVGRVLRIARGG